MSALAPAGARQTTQRRAALIVERYYEPDRARCIAAVIALLTPRGTVGEQSDSTANEVATPSPGVATGVVRSTAGEAQRAGATA